jgi:hypothetical protein
VFTAAQKKAFKGGEGRALLAIEHPNYGHIAVIAPEVRAELARDFS